MTAWRRIQRNQGSEVQPNMLIGFSLPSRVPVLILDAKHFRFHRRPYTFYVAFDGKRARPLSWILLPRYELREGYDRILSYFKRKRISISGVVSDWHVGLRAAVKDHYPGVIHQHCAFHVMAETRRRCGGMRFLATGEGGIFWEHVRKIAMGSPALPRARYHLKKAKGKYPQYARALRVLERNLSSIYQFTKCPVLKDFRTSNRIENFMGCLEQKIKVFRGIKTPETAIKILSSFIRIKHKRPTKK